MATRASARGPYDRAASLGGAAAYFPWLAWEWLLTKNALRPDQVTRASGREVVWRCEQGHAWTAVVYARTLSRSGCPTCYRLKTSERIKTGKKRARQIRDERATIRVAALMRHEPADEDL